MRKVFAVILIAVLLTACQYMPFPSSRPPETPAATPAVGSALPLAELKYRLIDQFGGIGVNMGIHFCDPDSFPVSRAPAAEQQQAARQFRTISQDTAQLKVILNRLGLPGATSLTPAQQLSVYREYKKLNAIALQPISGGYQFQFAYRDATGAFQVQGIIDNQGAITVQKKDAAAKTAFMCPICLVGNALIATPSGEIPVKDLREGMTVWTQDAAGKRVAAAILQTASVAVMAGHLVIDLRLSDGRELLASPGHPTADGRALGSLIAGDRIDGANVVSASQIAYPEATTYDILPAADAGFYWVNGILMGSTLAYTSQDSR